MAAALAVLVLILIVVLGTRGSPDTPVSPDASTGTLVQDCGRDEDGHRNADNLVISPGRTGAAQHLHDYVGNADLDAYSTEASMAAAGTTCRDGDLSSYYWPVLRLGAFGTVDGADAGTSGVLSPSSVLIEFRGNPGSQVVAPPPFLKLTSGDARAVLNGSAEAAQAARRVQWSCSGSPDDVGAQYPSCPDGEQVLRTFDFPSCWDGARTDSPDHRAHVTFPGPDGRCPADRFAIPRLRLRIGYQVPARTPFVIDAVPGQQRAAVTDHAHAIFLIPTALSGRLLDCLNHGQTCAV